MDPRIAEVRRQMAVKYQRTPTDQKPHIKLCGACHKPLFESKICPSTGKLHLDGSESFVGGTAVDREKKQFSGQELLAAINATRVRWQPSRITLLKVDATAVNIFQSFVLMRQWSLMRLGYLYGTVEKGVVTAHCIYEPEQQGSKVDVTLLPDEREARVDKLSALFGLQRVGIIVTHQPRRQEDMILSGRELLLIAKEQSRFGDHCVMVTIGPNPETKQIHALVWQASEQCVNLYRLGVLSEDVTAEHRIVSTTPLEIAEDTGDGSKRRCIIKEPSCHVDARWMTSFVAIETIHSTLFTNLFVRISQPGESPPTMNNLKTFFHDPKRTRLNFVNRIADFHVLVFLCESIFDIKTDMPILVEAVLTRKCTKEVGHYEELLKEYLRS